MAAIIIVGEFERLRGGALRFAQLRQAEVENLHRAIRCDLDVGGLQIAMDDSFLVRGLDGLRDLHRNGHGLVDGDRASRDPLGERLAFDELHHQKIPPAGFFHTMDRGNVGMIQ